jgi:hypothetical protein
MEQYDRDTLGYERLGVSFRLQFFAAYPALPVRGKFEMKQLVIASSVLLLMAVTGFAQETKEDRGQGYVFLGPGVRSPRGSGVAHFGGGGEALFRGFGVGGELGYLAPWQNFSNGIGVASANGSYHVASGKVSPFLTGGYSLFFRSATLNGFNFGGGVNYWFRENMALRFEVRDNVMSPSRNATHFVGFRVGLTFR